MLETFEGSAAAGAELLSIESVGGKEVNDEALTMCDIGQVIFALCVMGVLDWVRTCLLSRIAAGFETRLFPAAVEAAYPKGVAAQAVRDLASLRQALAGPVVTALFERDRRLRLAPGFESFVQTVYPEEFIRRVVILISGGEAEEDRGEPHVALEQL